MSRPFVPLTDEDAVFVRSLVIHEDEHIVAFNKPSGLSSQAGRANLKTLDELLGVFARSNGKRPVLVHRLDRDTSGVLLAAKTKPAAAFLGKALMARKVGKTYLAVCGGAAPQPPAGVIEAPLRRVEEGREAYMRVSPSDHADTETAVTRYRTLKAAPLAALVECRPATGRMHQIRVHMASIGRPIAGDARYGGALMLGGEPVSRLMLHAASLAFNHPGGGRLRIDAPPPADFAGLLDRLALNPEPARPEPEEIGTA